MTAPAMLVPASAPPSPYGHAYPYPYPPVYQPYPWPPVIVAPPRRRRRRRALRWFMGSLAILIVCSVVAAGTVVGYLNYTGAFETTGSWHARAEVVDAPPAANALASEWNAWARRSVDLAVRSQAKALLDGNETEYLAAVDPASTQLVTRHKRRFAALRAMGPGVWLQSVTGSLTSKGTRSWGADIRIFYCFGDDGCRAVQMVVASEWAVKRDRLVMVKLDESDERWNGPRPWETDALAVQSGTRVVVAGSKANEPLLRNAVRLGDRAAAVADKFSRWEEPPSRYVISLAAPDDWNQWYTSDERPPWVSGVAEDVSRTVLEVVVNTEVLAAGELELVLVHEMTHVATLAGKRDGDDSSAWWLVEGIAEYATMLDEPVRNYGRIPEIRRYVRGRWDGDPAVDGPRANTSHEEASARYGVAFLSMRRIADKYGEPKMLDFFGRVVHDDESLDTAARAALGASWSTVKADCARYVRTSVA